MPETRLRAASRFFSSAAFPAGSGPDYVNAVALIATTLPPEALLTQLHRIEADLGRERLPGCRWDARAIDLDLLALGDEVRPDAAGQTHWRDLPLERQRVQAPADLILPHPRLQDRGFVLAPLAEIAPAWRHPLTGQSVAAMLAALPGAAFDGLHPFPFATRPDSE